jgi:hypothetical protein
MVSPLPSASAAHTLRLRGEHAPAPGWARSGSGVGTLRLRLARFLWGADRAPELGGHAPNTERS